MAVLTYQQVYALAREAGLAPAAAVVATAVAKGESGFRTDAMGDTTIQTSKWGPSIGLWQVRSVKAESGKGTSRDATRLTDPHFNARSMAEISSVGKNFKPWSVFTNRSYAQYIGPAGTVAAGIDGDPTLTEKVLGSIANLPGVGAVSGAVAGAAGAVTGAVTDAASALNPLATWQADAQGIVIKSLVVAVGCGLFVAGAVRLVVPVTTGAVRNATGL